MQKFVKRIRKIASVLILSTFIPSNLNLQGISLDFIGTAHAAPPKTISEPFASTNNTSIQRLSTQTVTRSYSSGSFQAAAAAVTYTYSLVARSGAPVAGENVLDISRYPSINDAGKVGLVPREAVGGAGRITGIDAQGALFRNVPVGGGAFKAGDFVQVNNSDQLLYRASDGQLNPVSHAIRLDTMNSGAGLGVSPSANFFEILPGVSLNNPGCGVYGAMPDATRTILGVRCSASGTIAKSPALSGRINLYPMIADNGHVIVRWGGSPVDSILYIDRPDLQTATTLASTENIANRPDTQFTALGNKPGLSDDANLLIFTGDHRSSGRGVFAYVWDPATSSFVGLWKLADFTSTTNLDNRVMANRSMRGANGDFTLTYIANNASGVKTLYTKTVNILDPEAVTTSAATVIAQAGQSLPGFVLTIADIDINDAVNNKGQLVFWIQTTAGTRAVIKANPTGVGAGAEFSNPPIRECAQRGEPVYMHNGQYFYECTDLVIPGRGLDVAIQHQYRSGRNINGQFGYGWSLSYGERLKVLADNNVKIEDGTGRSDPYTFSGGVYTPPNGFYQTLTKAGNGVWTLTNADGSKKIFNANGTLARLEDRHGNAISFTYDTRGELPVIGLLAGSTGPREIVSMDYRLTKITDTIGREINLGYNADGLLETITDYANRVVRFGYDPQTNDLLTITKPATPQYPLGVTKTFTYTNHDLLTITDGRGQKLVTNRYDAQHRVYEQDLGDGTYRFLYETLTPTTSRTTITDRKNFVQVMEFNAVGNPTSIKINTAGLRAGEPASFTTTKTYNADMQVLTETTPKGSGVKYTYDDGNANRRARGNLLSVRQKTDMLAVDNDVNDIVTRYTYEPQFNFIKTMTDAKSNVTTNTYDYELPTNDPRYGTKGNLARIDYPPVNAQTPQVLMKYNANGQLTEMIDPETNTTQYAYYPANGYLEKIIRDPAGVNAVTTFFYDTYGNVTKILDALGHEKRFKYNELGWLVESAVQQGSTPPQFPITRYSYDQNGNLLRLERQFDGYLTVWQTTVFTYDKLNHVKTITDPILRVTAYDYDANENLRRITDHLTRQTNFVYDERNLLFTKTDANAPNGVTTYNYDTNGNLKEIRDANNALTAYQYDNFDRLERETFADTTYHQMGYDKNGNVLTHRTPSAQIITFTYDALNRPETKSYTSSAALNTAYTYDLASRLKTVNTTAANNTFTYDKLNRVKTNTQRLNGVDYTLTYDYDKAGNRTLLQYPNGRQVTYEYWSNDTMMRVNVANGGGTYVDGNGVTQILPLLATYNYDRLERLNNRSYIGSRWTNMDITYDLANQVQKKENKSLVSMQLGKGSVWDRVSMYDYTYDGVGNRKTLKHTTPAQVRDYTYGYNPIYELTSVSGAQTHAFDYDGVGNRETVDGVVYQKNNLNQYTFVGPDNLGYDNNGNLTSYRGDSFTYDEDNRMSTFSKAGVSAQYSYDGLNRRVKKVVTGGPNAGTTYFIYDGDRVIEERSAAGAVAAEYAWGPSPDELLGVFRGADKYYVLTDGLNSTTDIMGLAGTIVDRFTYDVYGAPDHVSATIPYLFTGQRYDAESGLYYYKARVYSPVLGRFLQREPLGYFDSMNLYSYGINNPVNYVDPDGKAVLPIVIFAGKMLLDYLYEQFLQDEVEEFIDRNVSCETQKNIRTIKNAVDLARTLNNPIRMLKNIKNKGRYFPKRTLPRDPHGKPVPDTRAPHTQLGTRSSKRTGETYGQAREFDAKGNPVRDVDFTDHNRPEIHTNPHQHKYDSITGKRGSAQPL